MSSECGSFRFSLARVKLELTHNITVCVNSAIIKFGPFRIKLELLYNFTVCVTVPSRYTYIYIIYSLVAGVSFDLFDSLYKPDAPKTTTVHVSDTRTDMLHCTATRWGLWLKHLAPDYKSIITPHYRALAVYAHSALGRVVITNTYMEKSAHLHH